MDFQLGEGPVSFIGQDGRSGRANWPFRAYRYGPDFLGVPGKSVDPERDTWRGCLYSAQSVFSKGHHRVTA